jgi:hypothetical protein
MRTVLLSLGLCGAISGRGFGASEGGEPALPKEEFWQRGPVCGPNTLYCLLRIHDKPVNYHALVAQLAPPDEGSSLEELRLAAERWGLALQAYRIDQKDFDALRTPFIAHLERNGKRHYVLVLRRFGTEVEVLDPERGGAHAVNAGEFFRAWTGYALATGTKTPVLVWCSVFLLEAICLFLISSRLLRTLRSRTTSPVRPG